MGSRIQLLQAQSVAPGEGEGSGTPPRFQDDLPEPQGSEEHISDDSEVFESPESGDKTSGETSVEHTISEGSGLEDSSEDRSPGPVQKGASAAPSVKVKEASVNQLSATEEAEEELPRLVTPEYSEAQVQTQPELQKAAELSRPQIKQHKADPIALPTGANRRHSDIVLPQDNMANANVRHLLTLQDASRLPKFDADKTKDPMAFKSQTEVAWQLLTSCNMPPNVSADDAKEVYLNRYAALKEQLVGRPLAWLTSEHDVMLDTAEKWKTFWNEFQTKYDLEGGGEVAWIWKWYNMIPQDFTTVLEFADKVHSLGIKLRQDEQEIVCRIKAQMPPEIMSVTDLLDSFSKIRQMLMRLQNLKQAYQQPKPATAAVSPADPRFMQAYVSGDQQQLGWNPQPTQGAASWSTQPQQGIPLTAWLNPGMPQTVAEEVRDNILNYVRSINNNGGGMTKTQGPQKLFDPNARGPMCTELPGRMVKANGMPMQCYNCQSTYHLAQDCPKNPNKRPQAPKYINLTHGGNVSSRQNHVNVVQSGLDSSETAGSVEEQPQLLPQIVGCGDTQWIPTEEVDVYQEKNEVLIQFSAIPGYLEATRGFAWLQLAALATPTACQLNAPIPSDVHSNKTQSAGSDCAAPQSQRNCRRCCIRCCRKLSLGSTDLRIDLGIDAAADNRQANPDDIMCVGKVVPTLTMGHGCPLAQALVEPAMPGAQFVQHAALVPVLAHHPGDPLLVGEQSAPACCQPTTAQIKHRHCCHQRWAQQQRKARQIKGPIGDQLEATQPICVCCGAKLWLPGHLNSQMQPWCMKVSCDRLPEDAQLSIQYLLSEEASSEERGILRGAMGDSHQGKQITSSEV